jgi:hypothetical protein
MAMQNHATGPAGQRKYESDPFIVHEKEDYIQISKRAAGKSKAGVTLTNYTNYPILNFLFIIMMI